MRVKFLLVLLVVLLILLLRDSMKVNENVIIIRINIIFMVFELLKVVK